MNTQHSNQTQYYPWLTIAGTIPFIAAAVLIVMDISNLPLIGSTIHALMIYGIMIVSFMAGSQWGLHLNHHIVWRNRLALFSNMIVIVLCALLLVTVEPVTFIAMALCFTALLIVDYFLLRAGVIQMHYFRLRVIASTVVIACLVTVILVML